MRMSERSRTIQVDYLARVEGETGLTIRLEGARAASVELAIFEPPRFFEALLRGRSQLEVPDITSRICGICPVAYLMSSSRAIEDALGIVIDGPLRELRRLIYLGEWIESHMLHVFLLGLPDFLGYPDAVSMASEHRELVQRGLRMKRAGNSIVATMGGRAIHPVNVRVGGFHRAPTKAELSPLLPELAWGREAARETVADLAKLPFPDVDRDFELVALRHPDEYAILDGRLVSTKGLDIAVQDYDAHFVEEQVPYSTALRSTLRGRGSYLCGPLARFNLSFDRLAQIAQEAAVAAGVTTPCRNPFKMIVVRAVEVLHAFDEATRIIESYQPPDRPYVEAPIRAATGCGCTEAPRGTLYHRYSVDEEGLIGEAKIVPPTSQNQRAMEEDLAHLAPDLAALPHDEATRLAERAIRNHDPCISCAAHFLRLRIDGV
jgi:coenzyme F420-reducing hydrogenase alpha subunit